MPYKLIVHTDGTFSVKNTATGFYHSKHTTRQKAMAQMRLLLMLEGKKK